MAKDPYKTLGVAKTASKEEIRKAYRKLAKKLHPDLNPDDSASAEQFKEVSAAYAIIGDEEKRKRFDKGEIDADGQERPEQQFYRDHAQGPDGARYYNTQSGGFASEEDLSGIFADLFGRRGNSGAQQQGQEFHMRGQDARYALAIDFLEAAKGAKKRITLPHGETLDVTVPAGVRDGQTIRLKGKGGAGLGKGPPGDALIEVSVRPHPLFTREGDDIHLTLPIGIDEAVLGGKVDVPTLTGAVKVTVPEGASSGQVLRLKGKGIARKNRKGDLLIELKIVTPKPVPPEVKATMEKWRASSQFDARANWPGRS
jgi:DnaJ-class molecular chaperone